MELLEVNPLKKIFWFAPNGLHSASVRYRAQHVLNHLEEEHGIKCYLYIPERSIFGAFRFTLRYLGAWMTRKGRDLIVIQKVCSTGIYARALKTLAKAKPNVDFDLDDAEHLRNPIDSLHFFIQHCRYVYVGSTALETYCLSHGGSPLLFSSIIHPHGIRKRITSRNKSLHLGWVGDLGNGNPNAHAYTHKTSLIELVFPAIRALNIPIRLSLIGVQREEDRQEIEDYFDASAHVELCIPMGLCWEDDRWLYHKISTFDVGLAPLVDHEFNRAKSAFKLKQYLSVGIPVLASPTGENQVFLKHNQTGLLCHSPEEFSAGIQRFAKMDDKEYARSCEEALDSAKNFDLFSYCYRLLQSHENKVY